MEKRRSKRKIVTLRAEIVFGGKSYTGVIENVSDKEFSEEILINNCCR